MAQTLQHRRGSTAEISSQNGTIGEILIDTTKKTVVVMDGSTMGGTPLAKESSIPTAISQLTNDSNYLTIGYWNTIKFSKDYNDLTNKPTLFSGAYADLTGKPTLFSGAYADLTGKPTLFDGAFSSLTGKPTTISGYGITDAFDGAYGSLTGTPTIPADVSDLTDNTNLLDHFSGSYNDLTNTPVIPSDVADLADSTNLLTQNIFDQSLNSANNVVFNNVDTSYVYGDGLGLEISGGRNTSGTGGTLTIVGGTSTGAQGGDVVIDAGPGSGGNIGSMLIGTSYGTSITIGTSGGTTDLAGTVSVSSNLTVLEQYSSTPTDKSFEVESGSTRILRSVINTSNYSAGVSPTVEFTSYKSSPTNGDVGPAVVLKTSSATSTNFPVATIQSFISDIGNGTETGGLKFNTVSQGSGVTALTIDGSNISVGGAVTYSTDTTTGGLNTSSPTTLDVTKTVLVLNSADTNDDSWLLPDGVEGQVIHLVPGTGTANNQHYVQIDNWRKWDDGAGEWTVVSGLDWIPFKFENTIPVYRSMATAVFVNGAWNTDTPWID